MNFSHLFSKNYINLQPPPSAYNELINYITETLKKNLDRHNLVIGAELGKGEFGAVNEGAYTIGGQEKKVAVKQLLSLSTEESRVRFLKEAAIMAQFDHPNIGETIFCLSLLSRLFFFHTK